jgi:hypothetical protein
LAAGHEGDFADRGKNKFIKEEQAMNNSTRWILFLGGIGVLVLGMYYFINSSSLFWQPYSVMGWRPYYFGPRTFPRVSFLGLLIAFIVGLVLYKLLFPSSGSQPKNEEKFCPYCGREFERSESISGVRPEGLEKEKASQ